MKEGIDEGSFSKAPTNQGSGSSTNMLLLCSLMGVAVAVFFWACASMLIDSEAGTQTWYLIACSVGGIIVAGANYWMINKVVYSNLRKVVDVVDALGDGDLSVRCPVNGGDVVGKIASSVNRMSSNLGDTIGKITDSTAKVSKAVNNMSGITTETSAAIQKQQTETDQAATAMNEMAATVQEVARNAESAAAAAREADTAAKDGSQVASTAMGGIQALTGEVEKASNVIQKLEEDSQSIGVILEVIQGIAEQTNLLALNAAIEAARAGEQGRGFAVVADEVRTLASRTQQSTEEIKRMIEKLQSGAGDAVKVMEVAREKAQVGEDSVEKAVESLTTIGGSVATIDEMNTQIASAAKEQGSVADEINANINSISEVAEQATAGADLTTQSGREIGELVNELVSVVSRFKR
jgi:methyl-accepting chemotaxis protein